MTVPKSIDQRPPPPVESALVLCGSVLLLGWEDCCVLLGVKDKDYRAIIRKAVLDNWGKWNEEQVHSTQRR